MARGHPCTVRLFLCSKFCSKFLSGLLQPEIRYSCHARKGHASPDRATVGAQNYFSIFEYLIQILSCFKPPWTLSMHMFPAISMRPKWCLMFLTPFIQPVHVFYKVKLAFWTIQRSLIWAVSVLHFLPICQTAIGGHVCVWISCTQLCFMDHHFEEV